MWNLAGRSKKGDLFRFSDVGPLNRNFRFNVLHAGIFSLDEHTVFSILIKGNLPIKFL